MWCIKCNHDLSECTCDDIDERFESLKNDKNFIFRMCRKCGLHYNRCKCDEPDWTTSHEGVELKDVQGGIKMFEFEKMKDNYKQRKVNRYDEGKLSIDTAAVNDSSYSHETAIKHPLYDKGEWIIVQTYNSKEEAIIGHEEWVERMTANTLPHELTDVSNNTVSMLCDMANDNWRTKKGGV